MIYLVKVEHKIQLTHIVKVLIQYFNKVVYSFKVKQIVVGNIDAYAEIKTCISSVNNFKVSEFNKIGVFCISDCYN